jgi:hypothetical protein
LIRRSAEEEVYDRLERAAGILGIVAALTGVGALLQVGALARTYG